MLVLPSTDARTLRIKREARRHHEGQQQYEEEHGEMRQRVVSDVFSRPLDQE
jgi:hypothetical protein